MTHGSQAGRAVSLQPRRIGPVAFAADVGRAATFQQHQTLLRRPHRPSRARTTSHFPSRVAGPMAPAVVAGVNGMMQQVLQGDPVGTTPLELTTVGTTMWSNG